MCLSRGFLWLFLKPGKDRRRVGLLSAISFAAYLAVKVEVFSLANMQARMGIIEHAQEIYSHLKAFLK